MKKPPFDRSAFETAVAEGPEETTRYLRRTDTTSANLRHISLSGVEMSGMDFEGSDFTGAVFTDCNVKESSFRCCNMHHVTFTGVTARGADFSHAHLEHVSIRNTDMTDANVYGARLVYANIEETSTLKGCNLAEADVTYARCGQIYFGNVSSLLSNLIELVKEETEE